MLEAGECFDIYFPPRGCSARVRLEKNLRKLIEVMAIIAPLIACKNLDLTPKNWT
jgi:hypothetical protein